MADALVSFVIERIYDVLSEKATFLLGVEDQVEYIRTELRRINCFLQEADGVRAEGPVFQNGVSELREIAYDAEDAIDSYIQKIASRKEHYTSFLTACVCLQVNRVGTEIEEIKSRLSRLATSLTSYGILSCQVPPTGSTSGQQYLRRAYAHVEEEHFVGMEDSISQIVAELVNKKKLHQVVSIIGMGGRGKTSLAKKVYVHSEVTKSFDLFSWFCVSQQYEVKGLLVKVLIDLIPDKRDDIQKMMEDELFEHLYKIQKEKRCLVVLDDIWTFEAWDSLKAAFPTREQGSLSRILITTRKRDIAKHMDPYSVVLEPKQLSEDESWELLKRRAFLNTDDAGITTKMEQLGKNMLKKCGYLPLAIKIIGGVLSSKRTLSEWESVHRSIHRYLIQADGEVNRALALSYDDLPYRLKSCFLYMGTFPEDSPIHVKSLIRLWIAEGFLSSSDTREETGSIETVGESYLVELVHRGMVEVEWVKKSTRRIIKCRLHDLMRDLCISKSIEQNFSLIISLPPKKQPTDGSSIVTSSAGSRQRRLAVYMDTFTDCKYPPPTEELELLSSDHLRTLLFFPNESKAFLGPQFHLMFENHKLLRVLQIGADQWHLQSVDLAVHRSIGNLVHLRCLILRGASIDELPSSIGNLKCVETLDLRVHRTRILTIPNVLWKMKMLKNLFLPIGFSVRNSEKLKLHTLTRLEILKNFSVKRCQVSDLEKFANLRRLRLLSFSDDGKGFEIFHEVVKMSLNNLQWSHFEFHTGTKFRQSDIRQASVCANPCKLYLEGEIERLPQHEHLPQHLKELILYGSRLQEDPMPVLEKLKHLIVLYLGGHSILRQKIVCSAGGFPQLRQLQLLCLPELQQWEVAEGSMPCLSSLQIMQCMKLEMVPDGLSHIAARNKRLEIIYWKSYFSPLYQFVKEEEGWAYCVARRNQ